MSFAKLSCSRPEKRRILIQTIDTGCVHKIAPDDLEAVADKGLAAPSTFITHDRGPAPQAQKWVMQLLWH